MGRGAVENRDQEMNEMAMGESMLIHSSQQIHKVEVSPEKGHLWFGFTKKMDDSRKNIFCGLGSIPL